MSENEKESAFSQLLLIRQTVPIDIVNNNKFAVKE